MYKNWKPSSFIQNGEGEKRKGWKEFKSHPFLILKTKVWSFVFLYNIYDLTFLDF